MGKLKARDGHVPLSDSRRIFTRRQHGLQCRACIIATIELQVCLSVHHVLALSKRRKLGSRSLHRRIPQGLVFGKKIHPEIRNSPRATALNESGIEKIRHFHSITRRISETVQDGTKVAIND